MKRLWVFICILICAVISGCAASSVPPLPEAPVVKERPLVTVVPDLSNVAIAPVPGKATTTQMQMRPGKATISGRVLVGGAPVEGATIHVERLVGDQVSAADVKSGADGGYGINGILGGRYRLRAYQPPDKTMPAAEVIFIGANENRVMDLNLQFFGGENSVVASVAPNPPFIGQDANLAISVTTRGVDGSGVARSIPIANEEFVLQTDGGRSINGNANATTNTFGRIQWSIRCNGPDNQGLRVIGPDGSVYPLTISPCREVPPTTTTTSVPATSDPPAE